MLRELSKDDKKWREMAFSICKDRELSDDLTNDMYLKLNNSGKVYKEQKNIINLVFTTIKNLFIDHIRKDIKKQKLFINNINTEFEVVECNGRLQNRILINDALNELSFFDREILMHTSERSLRKNRDYLDLTVSVLFYGRKNALKNLKAILINNE